MITEKSAMRWFHVVCVGGWVLSSLAVAQENETVEFDVITLKMPVELAAQLQRRIDEGGPAAKTAVDRLSSLAKEGKLEELDRWHFSGESGSVCTREIAQGRKLKTSYGESVPVGFTLKLEPSFSPNGVADVRMVIDEASSIKGDRGFYLSRQVNLTASIVEHEWVTLASWREEDHVVSFLAKFSGTVHERNDAVSGRSAQAAVSYSLCVLAEGSVKDGGLRPVSGAPARELLKNAEVLEAGSTLFRQNQGWLAGGFVYPLDVEAVTDLPVFSVEGEVMFSADFRTAEVGVIVERIPRRGDGKHRQSVAFSDWLELPVGTVTMIPLDEKAGPRGLWLALELKTKGGVPDRVESDQFVAIPPNARRLLAEAAGLPVPKPSKKKRGFAVLPELRESLERLGLVIPAGVELMDSGGTCIFMTGNNAPYGQLREILAKHLPAAP